MAKEARNSKKCSTKLRIYIPTVQCKLNVNAKYLLNEYILKSESEIKEKGRKKKKQTEKSTYPQIFQFIKIYKNIRGN